MLGAMHALRSLAVLAAFLMLTTPLRSQAAEDALRIWRVCVGDQPVLPYISNDPRHLGRGERLLVAAGRAAGVSVMLQRYPLRRCRAMLAAGAADMSLAGPTPQNLAEFQFPMTGAAPDPDRRVARLNLVWVKRADSPLDWDGNRLTGQAAGQMVKIGIRASQSVAVNAVRSLPVNIDETALTAKLQLRMLAAGRFDLALGLQDEFEFALADPELKPLVVLPRALRREDFYAVISRSHAATQLPLAERMWGAISKLRDLPEFQRD